MRYILALILLASPAFASRDPGKCGRVVAARLSARAIAGGGEIRMPKACPRIQVPAPYVVQSTSIGNVLLYPDGSVAATFLVPPVGKTVASLAPTPRPAQRRARGPRPVSGYHQEITELNGRAVRALVED